ncbi:MAG: hypothetical protein APF80_02360 [Alphaproteobacteria bacterium BRH_c36]|nr:MAG: hypothetical protein APF80_02360 [Alphaproteobacteria bacterium BRH_c36]
MAIIIDFTHMREVLESRPGSMTRAHDGPPEGEVVLFTGVRYERDETGFDDGADVASGSSRRTRKKK